MYYDHKPELIFQGPSLINTCTVVRSKFHCNASDFGETTVRLDKKDTKITNRLSCSTSFLSERRRPKRKLSIKLHGNSISSFCDDIVKFDKKRVFKGRDHEYNRIFRNPFLMNM